MRAEGGLSVPQMMQEEATSDMPRRHARAQEGWDVVWERSRTGRHTVVIGVDTLPPAPSDLQVVRVRCDAPGTPAGVLEAAHRCVAQHLGEEFRGSEPGRAPFAQGPRQRFLGDMPRPSFEAVLVDACNRLADQTVGRAVLAFEAIDAADEAAVDSLSQILQRSGWLRLPLLLTVRGTPQGRIAELVYLLYHDDGEAAVIAIEDEPTPGAMAALCDWTALPTDVLRVLRVGAVLGTTFDAALVARLLEMPLGMVLEQLQWRVYRISLPALWPGHPSGGDELQIVVVLAVCQGLCGQLGQPSQQDTPRGSALSAYHPHGAGHVPHDLLPACSRLLKRVYARWGAMP